MAPFLVLGWLAAQVLGWGALGFVVFQCEGRRIAGHAGASARRVAEHVITALAWSPVTAVAAVASLVVRARLASGAWPELGERRLDPGTFVWSYDGLQADGFPVHRTLVVLTAAVAWTLPLSLPSALGFRHGLGPRPCAARIAIAAGGWLAWAQLHVSDPCGFLAWTFEGVLWG